MSKSVAAKKLPHGLRHLRVGETAQIGDWCADHNTGEWGKISTIFGDARMIQPSDCERFARDETASSEESK